MQDFRFNTAGDVEGLRASILNHLKFTFARDSHNARRRDWWLSTCMAVRDRILEEVHRHPESPSSRECAPALLPFPRVHDGAAPREQPAQLRTL